jgi:hypothetical protein
MPVTVTVEPFQRWKRRPGLDFKSAIRLASHNLERFILLYEQNIHKQ